MLFLIFVCLVDLFLDYTQMLYSFLSVLFFCSTCFWTISICLIAFVFVCLVDLFQDYKQMLYLFLSIW